MSNSRDAGCWNRFRRFGIRPAKSILASGADVAGDWLFYLRVRDFGDEFDKYMLPLLVFAIVSSIMCGLLLWSLYLDYRCRCNSKNVGKWGKFIKIILSLEMVVEDIPQFVLTALVASDRGKLDGVSVFNLSTSGTNFVLNLLDMIEIPDDYDLTARGVSSQDDRSSNAASVEDGRKYAVPSIRR